MRTLFCCPFHERNPGRNNQKFISTILFLPSQSSSSSASAYYTSSHLSILLLVASSSRLISTNSWKSQWMAENSSRNSKDNRIKESPASLSQIILMFQFVRYWVISWSPSWARYGYGRVFFFGCEHFKAGRSWEVGRLAAATCEVLVTIWRSDRKLFYLWKPDSMQWIQNLEKIDYITNCVLKCALDHFVQGSHFKGKVTQFLCYFWCMLLLLKYQG